MKGLRRLDAFSLYMLSFFLSFGPPFTAAETIVFKWSISYWAAKVTPNGNLKFVGKTQFEKLMAISA